MDSKDIKILLRVDRQEAKSATGEYPRGELRALYRFLCDYFMPLLSDRNYSFVDLLQATASWAFEKEFKAVSHHLWDAADKFYTNH